MSDKKPKQSASTQPNVDERSELATLRQIVFGAAQHDIEDKIAALEKTMMERFEQTNQLIASEILKLSTTLQKGLDEAHEQTLAVDKCYDDKTAELNGVTDKLFSELEMSDASHKQDNDELHKVLEQAVAELTKKYDAQFTEALTKIEQVTAELSSSKTDRKTLAKLLAAMAVNLETDQQ